MAAPDDSDLIEHALGVLPSPDGDDAVGQATARALPRHLMDLSGRMLGEYIVRSRLAEGGFGIAYRCEQPLLGREVVVKVLHGLGRESVKRFLYEAQVASRLHHPYAAHVYAFGVEEHDDFAWIAMELVDGVTLERWLRRRRPMPLEQFVPFFEHVAAVVQAVHERGIIHRDLKPANIMVVEHGGKLLPKLLDFGIAKLFDSTLAPGQWPVGSLTGFEPQGEHAPGSKRIGAPRGEPTIRQLTRPSVLLGTPAYMSPEQAGAAFPIGPRSDLYSLGVIAYEALTGARPFVAETITQYAELHRSAPVPRLGGAFSPALDRLFQRALAKNPQDRWGSATEFAEALKIAANLGPPPVNFPRIDGIVRAEWIADAPQPLAESIAALDGARNAHEARDRVHEVVQHLLRYLTAVALATWSAAENDDQALLELVRALDRRELTGEERLLLLRILARSRDGHPIPELGELLTCAANGDDALTAIQPLYAITNHSGSGDSLLTRLHHLLPRLTELLSRTRFLLDYVLVVPVGDAVERWTGLREQPRVAELVTAGTMVEGHPMLLDRNGALCADLWPLVQVATPTDGDDAEMFLFDRRSRQGAQMIAAPRSLVRDDIEAWRFVSSRLVEDVKAKARMRDQIGTAARQWHDRARSTSLLWRGAELAELEQWLARPNVSLTGIDLEFALASRKQAQKELAEADARRRRTSRIRRWLVAGVAATAVAGIEYRRYLKAEMAHEVAEQSLTQAEIEQGRQALLHNESDEALTHLSRAYQRGDRSPGLKFMLARALQSRMSQERLLPSGTGRMLAATFSPDDQKIVTGDDREAQIWDAGTGQLLLKLPHGATVYRAEWAPDGSWIATAGGDGRVKIWDTTTAELRVELHASGTIAAEYFALAIAPSGRQVAAIDNLGKVADVWDVNTGSLLAELANDGTGWPSIAFSADGRWLATSGGGEILVFNASTWARVMTLEGHDEARVRSLVFDPKTPRLLTGSSTGDVSLWAVPSGARVHHFRDVGEAINAVAFSPDGNLVAAGASDGARQVWNANTGKVISQLTHHRTEIQAIEFDRSSTLVLAAGSDGSAVISNAAQGIPLAVLEGPTKGLKTARFDRRAQRVVGASADGTARTWTARPSYQRWSTLPLGASCRLLDTLNPEQPIFAESCVGYGTRVIDTQQDLVVDHLPEVTSVPGDYYYSALPATSTAGDLVAIARGDLVEIFGLPDGARVRAIAHSAPVNAVTFAPVGHDLVTGSIDGVLMFTRDGRNPVTISTARAGIDAVAILADGRIVAVDADRNLRIYDAAGKMLASMTSPTRVRSIRVSPDGHRLITLPVRANPSGPVLWDLDEYRMNAVLDGHVGRVFSVRFFNAGRVVVTAGADGAVRIWDGLTGHLQRTLSGPPGAVSDAALSKDASILVTGSADGHLRFWDVVGERALWVMRAHASYVSGIRFEGDEIVTRGFGGEVAKWDVSRPMWPELLDSVTRCLAKLPAASPSQPCDPARLRTADIPSPGATQPGIIP